MRLFLLQGVPSCSIQWGAWAGAGMAAGAPDLAQRLARSGLTLITPAIGLAALGERPNSPSTFGV